MQTEYTTFAPHLANLIDDHDTIIIHRHVKPDPDAIGSANGLAHLISHNMPNKKVLVANTDKSTNFDHYNHFPAPQAKDFYRALVIVVDTANAARIDTMRWSAAPTVVKIDHHPVPEGDAPFADHTLVDTSASSAAELITFIALENKWAINSDAARALYLGMVGDTGGFSYPNTTADTFHAAAELVRSDKVDVAGVRKEITQIPYNVYRLCAYMSENMCYFEDWAYIRVDESILAKFSVTAEDAHRLVNIPADIVGMKAWAVFIEDSGHMRTSLRSNGPVINHIAQKHGGGGHPLAAGCKVDVFDGVREVVEELQAVVCED